MERIHKTSTVLRLLRQFAHAKAQLELHISSNPNGLEGNYITRVVRICNVTVSYVMFILWGKVADSRQLSSIAKTLSDLEALIKNPSLQDVRIVLEQVNLIQQYGTNLRHISQHQLLTALKDRHQATVASCLQVRGIGRGVNY